MKPVLPSHIKKDLNLCIYVAKEIIEGLEGKPFHWDNKESSARLFAAQSMGATLKTQTWIEKNGYQLKQGVKPVGKMLFRNRRDHWNNWGELYVLECQTIKKKADKEGEEDV